MNREAVKRFPTAPYGVVHAVYEAAYDIMAPTLEGRNRRAFEDALQRVPGAFYVHWLLLEDPADFEDLCAEHGVSTLMGEFLRDCLFYYLLSPEALADYIKYCERLVILAERSAKRRTLKSKTPYDILHDVEPFVEHMETTVIPREMLRIGVEMRRWLLVNMTLELWRERVEYLIRYTYMVKKGVDTGEESEGSVASSAVASDDESDADEPVSWATEDDW